MGRLLLRSRGGRPSLCLLLLAAVLLADRPADACSCAMPPSPLESYLHADLVFVGRVVAREEDPERKQLMDLTRFTLEVQELLKGPLLDRVTIPRCRRECVWLPVRRRARVPGLRVAIIAGL